uniref:DUF19 domain-containing protein n=1 Tax=Syphacia muris TaxID=451379 RepID=A0A158R5R1_9BILA
MLVWLVIQISLLICTTASEEKQKSNVSQCPANTFACNDGSCIPLEWIGDGEPDCDNGADEHPDAKPLPTVLEKNSTKYSSKSSRKISLTQEDGVYDPFDQISTKPATTATTATTASVQQADSNVTAEQTISTTSTCSAETRNRLDQCTDNFLQWVMNFSSTDFYNKSLLFNEDSLNELSQGCDLLSEYRTCTENLNITDCKIDETVLLWSNVELYLCQLLLPSVNEHQKCFALASGPKCSVKKPTTTSAEPLCDLLTSIGLYVDCIQAMPEGVCDERAVEILEPFKIETANVFEDLRCRQRRLLSVIERVLTTDRKCMKQLIAVNDQTTNKISFGNDCLECANPLYLLTNIETICENVNVIDMWSAVRRIVCDKKAEVIANRECFKKAEPPKKCDEQPVNKFVCAALTQFNTNLECIKPVIEEQCSDDAEAVVSSIQDTINDNIISQRCFALQLDYNITNDDFSLSPLYPKCSSQQENVGLACLVQLTDLNRYLTQLQSLNFLMEISDENSTLIGRICDLYANYTSCIDETVFSQSSGARCSFNLPLNTLARIGLSPMCDNSSRELLSKNRKCMEEIREDVYKCRDALAGLENAINMMLQGINGEALLCKSFYSIRKTFDCAEELIEKHCSQEAGADILQLREQMTVLGIEEGCPAEEPAELDKIISKQLDAARMTVINSITPPPVAKVICEREEQKKFQACVQPITNFQPHPLAVIKQPKLIDEACLQFKEFKKCQAEVNCHPLWATGMSAMFEYACGPGYSNYVQIRQCVRKVTTRDDIRECVAVFSKGEPQHACQSSNALLACARSLIAEKCGPISDDFIKNSIEKFATAIDPSCKIIDQYTGSVIRTFNCTLEEDILVQQCAVPINELSLKMDELFQGGLQAFLANVKNLAPVFSQGCNLTGEFRQCAQKVLESETCMVSSCMIRAGYGICHRPDTAAAIDENLECVFKQASNQEFSKCVRSTISTLSVLNLATLRSVLPQFVSCVEHIIVDNCGQTPLNLLRALSTTDFCQITADTTPDALCTEKMKQKHANCVSDFFKKYKMTPVGLVQGEYDVSTLCSDVEQVNQCTVSDCELSKERGFIAMLSAACAKKNEFEKQSKCLSSVAASEAGLQCFEPYFGNHNLPHCTAMTRAIDCIGSAVLEQCGVDALEFSVDAMNKFSQQIGPCLIRIKPTNTKATECTENDLVTYLQCETATDPYGFSPLAYLKNATLWNEFCKSTLTYRHCVSNMPCKIEPLTTATLTFYKAVCGDEDKLNPAPPFASCLSNYIDTDEGQKCLEPFRNINLLAKEGAEMICSSIDLALSCSESTIYQNCGQEALQHVYNTHVIWGQAFNKSCVLTKPSSLAAANEIAETKETKKVDKNKLDIGATEAVQTTILDSTQQITTIITSTLQEADEISFTTQLTQVYQPQTTVQAKINKLFETTRTMQESTAETEPENDLILQTNSKLKLYTSSGIENQPSTASLTTQHYEFVANLEEVTEIPDVKITLATEIYTIGRNAETVNPILPHNGEIEHGSNIYEVESTTTPPTTSANNVRAASSRQTYSPLLHTTLLLLLIILFRV